MICLLMLHSRKRNLISDDIQWISGNGVCCEQRFLGRFVLDWYMIDDSDLGLVVVIAVFTWRYVMSSVDDRIGVPTIGGGCLRCPAPDADLRAPWL